jgi:hypothetical protein
MTGIPVASPPANFRCAFGAELNGLPVSVAFSEFWKSHAPFVATA